MAIGAEIGDGVKIGDRAAVISITHKYIGTLAISKNDVQIKIGCEVHPITQWKLHGKILAQRHAESVWWEQTGKYMLELLISEAKLFTKNKLKRDSKGRFC